MYTLLQIFVNICVILFLFFLTLPFIFPNPCARIIAYSIGTLDARFNVSHEEFLEYIREAESAWEEPFGENLFTYDPAAEFTVNLVYDDRQERTDRAKTISGELEKTVQTRDEIKREYDRLVVSYEKAEKVYGANVAAYEQAAQQLQTDIQRANASGGVSEDQYTILQERQKELLQTRNALEQERVHLNTLAERINALAGSEHTAVNTYNLEVEKFNEALGDESEFGQGEYTGTDITIYEFTSKRDLQIVLQHEFGHVLGLDHLPNPATVMYYLVHEKNLALDGPTEDDLFALRTQCKKTSLTIFLEKLRNSRIIQGIQS